MVQLSVELDAAFTRFQAMGYPFVDKRDWTKYPVQVWLKELKRIFLNLRRGIF